ncbi:MAG: hypothetical protein H6673_05655 [Anaerolineales bacterium]|nr:hypothetical protein [Anaerolineales bacterium]
MQRLCPNCRNLNPPTATICRECGYRLGGDVESPPTVSPAIPVWLGTPLDWIGVFFSGGMGLGRYCRGGQNWSRFVVDMLALSILNGLLGLLTVIISLNSDSALSVEITDLQLSLGVTGDAARLINGILIGLGFVFLEVAYVGLVYAFTLFFEGTGDLSDHLHLFFAATIGRNLITPVILAIGMIDIRLFIAVALLLIVYGYFLYVRIIQAVHRLSLPIAILPVLVAPAVMNAILNFI